MLRIGIVALVATLGACGLAGSQAERENTPAAKQRSQQKPTGAPVWKKLTSEQARVIEQCGTERPFSGKFVKHKANGTYTCARCGAPLFSSKTKFDSGTGWPSFDDALPGAVREKKDPDGRRTEIVCGRCGGHLGHVFRGERMTIKNTRHCVNSLALGFAGGARAEAFFAGGCFWGVEHLMEKMPGVLSAQSGYMGGHVDRPTYRQVVSGQTGHAETVRIIFDPSKVTYEKLARMFFEIHDPTQVDRQGPDRGTQYRSAVFVTDAKQRKTIEELIKLLAGKGYKVATKIHPAAMFWPAEAYHQDYYRKTGKAPYCHARTSRF